MRPDDACWCRSSTAAPRGVRGRSITTPARPAPALAEQSSWCRADDLAAWLAARPVWWAATAPRCTPAACRRRRGRPRRRRPTAAMVGRAVACGAPGLVPARTPCCPSTAARRTPKRWTRARSRVVSLQAVPDAPRHERAIRPMQFTDLGPWRARAPHLHASVVDGHLHAQLARESGSAWSARWTAASPHISSPTCSWTSGTYERGRGPALPARSTWPRPAGGLLRAHRAQRPPRPHARGASLQRRRIELYRSFGFVATGIRPGYYSDDREDASSCGRTGRATQRDAPRPAPAVHETSCDDTSAAVVRGREVLASS